MLYQSATGIHGQKFKAKGLLASSTKKGGSLYQYWILFNRSLINYVKNPGNAVARVIVYVSSSIRSSSSRVVILVLDRR